MSAKRMWNVVNRAAAVLLAGAMGWSPALAQQPSRQKQPQQQKRSASRPPAATKPQKTPRAPVQNAEATVERLRKLLRLNDDQVFQLRTMVNNRNLEIARAYQDRGAAGSRRMAIDSIQEHFQSEIRTLLTPEQTDRFERGVLEHPGAFR